MRNGGGLTVGLNLIRAFGRVEPQNEYLFVAPRGVGYEEIVARVPNGRMCAYAARHLATRWLLDMPHIVHEFRPDALITLAGRGLQHPDCVQMALTMDAHYYYPRRQFGCETRGHVLLKRYHAWYFGRQLRRTQVAVVQTPLVERLLRARFGYLGRTMVCSSALSSILHGARRRCARAGRFCAAGGGLEAAVRGAVLPAQEPGSRHPPVPRVTRACPGRRVFCAT
jgi:hypothetical protein